MTHIIHDATISADMVNIDSSVKTIIESNPVAFATVMTGGNPNVIGVAYVKVVDNLIIISDVYMKQTLDDIRHNSRVVVLGWDKQMTGYKILGKASYYTSGVWMKFVKSIPENKDMPVKGVVVVEPLQVIKTK